MKTTIIKKVKKESRVIQKVKVGTSEKGDDMLMNSGRSEEGKAYNSMNVLNPMAFDDKNITKEGGPRQEEDGLDNEKTYEKL